MNNTNDRIILGALLAVLLILAAVAIYFSITHNDPLASKYSDFIYGDLGALWGFIAKGNSKSPEVGQ